MLPRIVLAVIVIVGLYAVVSLGLRFRKRRSDKSDMDDMDWSFLLLLGLAVVAVFAVPWLIA
jgi:hypothetical protein